MLQSTRNVCQFVMMTLIIIENQRLIRGRIINMNDDSGDPQHYSQVMMTRIRNRLAAAGDHEVANRVPRTALRTAIGFGKRDEAPLMMEKIRKKMPFSARKLSTAINYGKRDSPFTGTGTRVASDEPTYITNETQLRDKARFELLLDALFDIPEIQHLIMEKINAENVNSEGGVIPNDDVYKTSENTSVDFVENF